MLMATTTTFSLLLTKPWMMALSSLPSATSQSLPPMPKSLFKNLRFVCLFVTSNYFHFCQTLCVQISMILKLKNGKIDCRVIRKRILIKLPFWCFISFWICWVVNDGSFVFLVFWGFRSTCLCMMEPQPKQDGRLSNSSSSNRWGSMEQLLCRLRQLCKEQTNEKRMKVREKRWFRLSLLCFCCLILVITRPAIP